MSEEIRFFAYYRGSNKADLFCCELADLPKDATCVRAASTIQRLTKSMEETTSAAWEHMVLTQGIRQRAEEAHASATKAHATWDRALDRCRAMSKPTDATGERK